MHFDVFTQGKSFFHLLDPRMKIGAFIPLVFIVALLTDLNAAGCYLLLAIAFTVIARVNIGELKARLAALNVFIVLLWITLPFSIEGKTLFTIGTFAFTLEGALYTTLITLKANAILLFTISLLGTTDVFRLAHALFHLKFPRKLVYMSIFMYRYLSVLHAEYDRLKSTVKVRSFHPGTNFNTIKTYAYMAGMLFVNSYERSQRVYQALTLRGFRGDFPMLRHFHLHRADVLFGIFMLLVIMARFIIWK
jgi:cobalt/nickel transport system permease protein